MHVSVVLYYSTFSFAKYTQYFSKYRTLAFLYKAFSPPPRTRRRDIGCWIGQGLARMKRGSRGVIDTDFLLCRPGSRMADRRTG